MSATAPMLLEGVYLLLLPCPALRAERGDRLVVRPGDPDLPYAVVHTVRREDAVAAACSPAAMRLITPGNAPATEQTGPQRQSRPRELRLVP